MRMNLNIFKRAFSLTELLIVLVIVAVLFAASAPIISKRFSGAGSNVESVWRFTDGNQHDAYFDSEVPSWTSAGYVGLKPKDLDVNSKRSKLTLKAVENQDMIQFRYGEGDGIYTGSFTFDDKGNIKSASASSKENVGNNNTVAGASAFSNYNNPQENVAIGARTLSATKDKVLSSSSNLALGVNSGEYLSTSSKNTFVGVNTGRTEIAGAINDTVAVGANVLNGHKSVGNNNVFAGANVASAGLETASHNNILLNSNYYGKNIQNNTIIGYDAYVGKTQNQSYLTTLGYEACFSVSDFGDGTTNTCIGYGSAKNKGLSSSSPTSSSGGTGGFDTDKADHIYLGGSPNGFGGRSVLEVHNFSRKYGPTVVMNSNLVVRGNLFVTDAADYLSTHGYTIPTGKITSGNENSRDSCCRKPFRSKKWNNGSCSWLNIIIGALIGLVLLAGAVSGIGVVIDAVIITAVHAAAAAAIGAVAGGAIGALFGGSGKSRPKDPPSFTELTFGSDGAPVPKCVTSKNANYPTTKYCPDLKLSDINLKENISENNDAIEKIMLVMPYNYSYKADKDNTPQVGVIAQDLEKYLPNSVSTDNEGYLQIRRDELFYVTINSIKTLNNKLTTLSSDVDNIEKDSVSIKANQKNVQKRIESLNKRVNKLEK